MLRKESYTKAFVMHCIFELFQTACRPAQVA